MNNDANATNNILNINSSLLTEQTIWLWNQATGSYDILNQSTGAFHIAPGQGFFVKANSGSSTFAITEAMQSHQGSDSFQRNLTSTRPEINLVLTNGSLTRDTDIFYINGTTTGFDNGYDSSVFGGVASSFNVYTHAVANGEGRDLGIQSLPDSNFENMIVPVGVDASAGSNLAFTVEANNLPAGIDVYIEDTLEETFTKLNEENGSYAVLLDNDLNGIGRFYLHTTSQALGVVGLELNKVSVYTSSKDNLRIAGVQNGTATVRLYNILGKEMLKSSFVGSGVNDIKVNAIPVGIYIVKLTTENGTLNRKIIIQ
jgi:hypothetical protein